MREPARRRNSRPGDRRIAHRQPERLRYRAACAFSQVSADRMADGGTDPQHKAGAANEIALSEGEAPAPDHPVAQRTAQQRVAGVGAEPDSDEDDTEHDEVLRNRPISLIHELRLKGD